MTTDNDDFENDNSDFDIKSDISMTEKVEDIDSSNDAMELFDDVMTTGYPMLWVKSILKYAKLNNNNNVSLWDNEITGVELIGYIVKHDSYLVLAYDASKIVSNQKINNQKSKKKPSKIEIDEDDEDNECNLENCLNRTMVKLIIVDDHVNELLNELKNSKNIISVIGTVTINKSNINDIIIELQVNHFKIINKFIKKKKDIKAWITISTTCSKKYLQSTQELPLPWWETSRETTQYANDNSLTFQEWIDGNPLYSRHASFISSLGVSNWSDFKNKVVDDVEKYQSFVTCLEEQMNEQIISKFINDTMKAIAKYA